MQATNKVCPECKQELSAEHQYCPFDGTQLPHKPINNYCSSCEKDYADEFQFCPVHGEELTSFTLPLESLEIENDEGMEAMDDKALDSFSRGLCPKCGALKNWGRLGNEYTCQTCSGTFIHENGQLFGSKAKSALMLERERQDALPYTQVLSAIDEANKQYWLPKFEKFDSSPKYFLWNWPSFFFGVNRYFWKGMWKKGLIIFAIIMLGGFWAGVLDTVIAPSDSSISAPVTFIFWIAFFGLEIYLGANGAKDYHKHVQSFEGDLSKAKTSLKTGRILFAISIAINFLSKVLT
jgi:hypothetical protein